MFASEHRRFRVLQFLALIALGPATACGGECEFDTDCPVFERCSMDTCVPVEVRDAGGTDSGSVDSGSMDAGPTDAGPTDAGPPDAGPLDAGPPDAGPEDAGSEDAGSEDAGA